MLDMSDPMAKHILYASALMDKVKIIGQQMTVSTSAQRQELLGSCRAIFEKMRGLAYERFAERAQFIDDAIDEYEIALTKLSDAGGGNIDLDLTHGIGDCAVCGQKIMRFQPMPNVRGYEDYWIVVCGTCDQDFMRAEEKLECSEGFCTWVI